MGRDIDLLPSTRQEQTKTLSNVPITLLVLVFGFLPTLCLSGAPVSSPLPDPAVTGNSVELCLNSRVSDHGGWSGEAPDQWLSTVLWAAGEAPITGGYRDIHVTTPEGEYLYDPENHSLSYEAAGDSSPAAFILVYDRERDFDAGVSYMTALLASVSLWNGTTSQLASCPMQQSLYFGMRDVRGLTSELVVNSSDGSLPDPSTDGSNNLEDVLANLKYTDKFAHDDLSLPQVSQILWAGYGCTPHNGTYGRAALTVPSWSAEYYLTGRIYVVKQDGAFRYHNRKPPGNDLFTRDHRIELINPNDIREILRSNVSDLPSAPCYVILCLKDSDAGLWYARLETGFVAGNMLMQASALGLNSYFTTNLSEDEKERIQNITGIPAQDIPHAIVSIGELATSEIFDTGLSANPYPSIRGTHNGTLTPNVTLVEISKLYTYPCTGTGGHTEQIRIYNESGTVAEANWTGYNGGDWHTITFPEQFTLEEGKTYNYTIRTGSYPQIYHLSALQTANGWINCTEFIDANGKEYDDWIPAIKFE
jgi:hypothetical protein